VEYLLGYRDGDSEIREVEKGLDEAWARLRLPQALNESAETAHEECLSKGEIENADQDEQEIRGHCCLDARKPNFEDGRSHRYCHETGKSKRVFRVPMKNGVNEQRDSCQGLGQDENRRWPTEKNTRFTGHCPDAFPPVQLFAPEDRSGGDRIV